MTPDVLSQHSDNEFRTAVRDVEGVLTPASDYTDAEYIIAHKNGEVFLRAKLGDGISVDGDDFVTKIDDGLITFEGKFIHQFVVHDIEGNKLPPVFVRPVVIKSTFINKAR